MRGIATLAEGAILVGCTVCVHSVRAVVLLVRLAVCASQVCLNLRTNTDAVADLDGFDCITDLHGLADHLVADAERKGCIAPAASDGVDVGRANTAHVNGDVDVTVLERLELELALGEFGPL